MPITPVSPTSPVSAVAQGADAVTSSLVLQPGSVISAQVLDVLAENLVRISIANMSLDVMSEVPLTPGQNLQLAVSQNDTGIRLAVLGQGSAAGASSDTVALSPNALAVTSGPNVTLARNVLTPIEQMAVAVASQSAAAQQGSQAPLFANLAASVTARFPPALQQAVLQVLAQRTPLDPGLSGEDIQAAFQKSGLFLEASLASGALPSAGGVPDLKAALIVLRQALATSLADSSATSTATPATPQPTAEGTPAATSGIVVSTVQDIRPSPKVTVELAPPLVPEIELGQPAQAQSQPESSPSAAAVAETVAGQELVLTEKLMNNLPRALRAGAALNLLQQAGQDAGRASAMRPENATPSSARNGDTVANGNTPPPFRSALPSAQPVASPSIAPHAELPSAARHLLENTDAAIARQTLLQVASLPDRTDTTGQRIDTHTPQWNFEIPFATPQGTAMAQFAISRDGGGSNEVEPGKRVWRARFSLDVEPAGPVHALISFSGEKTSVRMWAERPATLAQLRAGVSELNLALTRAELKPGEIVVADGTPPQAAPPQAGHFLDRAL